MLTALCLSQLAGPLFSSAALGAADPGSVALPTLAVSQLCSFVSVEKKYIEKKAQTKRHLSLRDKQYKRKSPNAGIS